MPPLNTDERTTLESWLDFHRTTLAMKCEGLDDKQAAVASVPPSGLTLTGLGGFELAEDATLRDALATWRAEIARAREHCAERALADTGRFMEQDVNLRWIYVHMIEEYARHNGHADLLRERIDGAAGV